MKRFIPFAAFLLVLAVSSCQDEFVPGIEEERYSLRFLCDGLQTKSEESKGLPQERVLKSIDVYFYRDGETSSDAEFHTRMDLQDCYDLYNAHIDFLASEVSSLFYSSATCEVFAIANVDASLLPGNVTDDLTGSSMPELMSKTVSSTFGSLAGEDHIPSSFVMTGYNTVTLTSRAKTTVATGVVPMYRLAAKLELLVHVQDTIHLRTTYKDEYNNVYPAEEVWKPMTDRPGATAQVEAYLENGYKEASLGVYQAPATYMPQIATTTPMSAALTEKFFKYSKNKMPYDDQTTITITETRRWTYSDFQAGLCTQDQVGHDAAGQTVNTVYMYSDPSYTYPITWDRGVEKEPFFKLCLPWAREGYLLVYRDGLDHDPVQVSHNTAQKQYYYKIIFPVHTLASNNFYRLKMNVAILGSETEDALVEMEPTYAVAGWQNKTEILEEAEVGNARFLSVAQPAYTLYNEVDLSVPFVSSDACIIYTGGADIDGDGITDNPKWTRPIYGSSSLATSGSAAGWLSINADGKHVDFHHTLNNTNGTSMDTSPYTITFYVCHEDDYSFNKKVVITQYPAIYITKKTGGGVMVDGYYSVVYASESPSQGAILYNNSPGSSYPSGFYRHTGSFRHSEDNSTRLTPYGNLSTSAPDSEFDLTCIYVTAFSDAFHGFSFTVGGTRYDYDYIIGDPRVPWDMGTLTDYMSSTGTQQAWTQDQYDKLKKSTTVNNIIAPAFMLASEWGRQSSGTSYFETVSKRCATYQEAGYPAGRWRVPTMAEVIYCAELQKNGFIGQLFKNGQNAIANGTQYVSVSTNSYSVVNGNCNTVRCVYDIWYWGEDPVYEYSMESPYKPYKYHIDVE